jgi:hypothetical protein
MDHQTTLGLKTQLNAKKWQKLGWAYNFLRITCKLG